MAVPETKRIGQAPWVDGDQHAGSFRHNAEPLAVVRGHPGSLTGTPPRRCFAALATAWSHGPALAAAARRQRRIGHKPRMRLVLPLAFAALCASPAAAEGRGSIPPQLQRSAMVCLGKALRLCPNALTARDHGLSCILGQRRLLTAPCRAVDDQGLQLLDGRDAPSIPRDRRVR